MPPETPAQRAPWVVNIKGDPDGFSSFEISLVRADNRHGLQSFGWGIRYQGPPNGWLNVGKIILAEGGGGGWAVTPLIAQTMIRAAKELRDALNTLEQSGDSVTPAQGTLLPKDSHASRNSAHPET